MIETVSQPTGQFFKEAFKELILSKERAELLDSLAETVTGEIQSGNLVNLNFICTHNSRRSMFAQVWGHFAAEFFELKTVRCFSGGTAATAFFRNTVKSLQQTGFTFKLVKFSHSNPHYLITYPDIKEPIVGFSKLYDHITTKKPFIAITTCDSADENCPFISDAKFRFHLPFVDPKKYDNTKFQAEKYLETQKKIAGEIYYLFEKVKNSM